MFYLNEKDFMENKELPADVVQAIVKFINANDLKTIACGRYDVNDKVCANIFESETAEDSGVFEMHKEYIDIHYLIEGKENIKYDTTDDCEILSEYDKAEDYQLFKVKTDNIAGVECGGFAVFLTGEKHNPCIANGQACKVKKAVFKVLK